MAKQTTRATTRAIDPRQLTYLHPLPGGRYEAKPTYGPRDPATGKSAVTGYETRDGHTVFQLDALGVVPFFGYIPLTVETLTAPETLALPAEPSPETRLVATGAAEMRTRGADFSRVEVTVFAETLTMAAPNTKRAE